MKMENKNTNNNGALKYNTKIIIIQVRVGVGAKALKLCGFG